MYRMSNLINRKNISDGFACLLPNSPWTPLCYGSRGVDRSRWYTTQDWRRGLTAQAWGFWCGGEEERAFTALSSGAIRAPHLLVYSGRGIHPLKLLLLLTTLWGTWIGKLQSEVPYHKELQPSSIQAIRSFYFIDAAPITKISIHSTFI